MIKLTFQSIDLKKQWCKTSISKIPSTRTTDYYANSNSPNWRTHIQSKWDVSVDQPSCTFDISSRFYFDVTKAGFCRKLDNPFGRDLSEDEFELEMEKDDWTFKRMISSHLLLYRTTCTFPDAIKTSDEYKFVWQCLLKHKATGRLFGFSEWKGCPSIRGTTDDLISTLYELADHRNADFISLVDRELLRSPYETTLPDKVFESLPSEEARTKLREYLDANKVFLPDILELMNYIVSDQCEHPYDNLVAGCIA